MLRRLGRPTLGSGIATRARWAKAFGPSCDSADREYEASCVLAKEVPFLRNFFDVPCFPFAFRFCRVDEDRVIAPS
jgi:hypothetical protein